MFKLSVPFLFTIFVIQYCVRRAVSRSGGCAAGWRGEAIEESPGGGGLKDDGQGVGESGQLSEWVFRRWTVTKWLRRRRHRRCSIQDTSQYVLIHFNITNKLDSLLHWFRFSLNTTNRRLFFITWVQLWCFTGQRRFHSKPCWHVVIQNKIYRPQS